MKSDTKIQVRTRGTPRKLHIDTALPPLALQHVWYEMKQQREWRSVALVPVTDDIKTLAVAHGLGLMAVREPHDVIWVVNASSGVYDPIRPADENAPSQNNDAFPYKYVDLAELGINQEKQLVTAQYMLYKLAKEKHAKMSFIFSVDAIVNKTHPIPLCRTVDAVILCIALGKSSSKNVRRTVEIIGRDRILGSIILRPGKN